MEIMLSVEPKREEALRKAIEQGTDYTYQGIKIINVDFFHTFVTDKAKADFIDFEKYLDELIGEANDGDYELRSTETKSGNPETIGFEYTYSYDEDKDLLENQVIEF